MTDHYVIHDTFSGALIPQDDTSDPFSEGQKSKTAEHEQRFSLNAKNSQKSKKHEEN